MNCVHEGLRAALDRLQPYALLYVRMEGCGRRPGMESWPAVRKDAHWYARQRCGDCRGKGLIPSYWAKDGCETWCVGLCPQCGAVEPVLGLEG